MVQKEYIELQKLSDMAFTQSFMSSNLLAQARKQGRYMKGRNTACEGDFENWAEVMNRACDQVLHVRG